VLDRAGYKDNEKTLFIWEGVSYYLELDSVNETLKFVNKFSHHESKIVLDYTVSINENNLNEYFGVKEFVQTMKKHHANEALLFSINENEIETFLNTRGFKIVEHLDNKDMEKSLLTDENGKIIGQVTGHFRFVLAASEK
jgi:methyltransferase (TIGR00027 family)